MILSALILQSINCQALQGDCQFIRGLQVRENDEQRYRASCGDQLLIKIVLCISSFYLMLINSFPGELTFAYRLFVLA